MEEYSKKRGGDCSCYFFRMSSSGGMGSIKPFSISSLVLSRAFLMTLTALSHSSCLLGLTRATPSLMLSRAQATASQGKTSHSSIRGTMSFSVMPRSSANFASSSAAATHMSSVTVLAFTSNTPRKIAGNPRLLLI